MPLKSKRSPVSLRASAMGSVLLMTGAGAFAQGDSGSARVERLEKENAELRKRLDAIESVVKNHPNLLIVADSRRGLSGYPCVSLKMNRAEFAVFAGSRSPLQLREIKDQAALLAKNFGKYVFVTLAEEGMVGAAPNGEVELVPALPLRGEIDIVGAGDTVTANLTVALAAGATLREALEIATAAASIVIHQLGTTGTATVSDIEKLLIKS